MPNFGVSELLIILGIVVLFFGVGKLPAVGIDLGKSIGGIKKNGQGRGTVRCRLGCGRGGRKSLIRFAVATGIL